MTKFLKSLVLWVIAGFVVGVSMSLAKRFLGFDLGGILREALPESALNASEQVAMWIGGSLIFVAVMIGIGSVFPKSASS